MKLAAIALAVLAATISTAAADQQPLVGPEIVSEQVPQQYIFPVLLYGPNNQKRDLRHVLAFAKQLDMGIMVTGIFKHYLDTGILPNATELQRHLIGNKAARSKGGGQLPECFPTEYGGLMPFESVLDRAPIAAWLPTASLEELKARGWDGQLDAVVYGGSINSRTNLDFYLQKALRGTGVRLPPGIPEFGVRKPMKCNGRLMETVKQQLKPYRYIAALGIVPGYAEKATLSAEPVAEPEDKCNRTVHQAHRLIRPAPWIRKLAQSYREKHMGGARYLAVHVRPYPDTCMQAWSGRYGLDLGGIEENCDQQHKVLHERLGPCVAATKRRTGVKKVFILSHPDIRANIHMLLEKAGVTGDIYIDSHKVMALSECHDASASFLLMVEEAIAAEAAAFLGTHRSSITHSIVYERLSINPAADHTYLEECMAGDAVPTEGGLM